jgi:hypothetical protein
MCRCAYTCHSGSGLIATDTLDLPAFHYAPAYNPPDGAPAGDKHIPIERNMKSWNAALSILTSKFTKAHAASRVSILDTEKVFMPFIEDPEAHGAPNNHCLNSDGLSW